MTNSYIGSKNNFNTQQNYENVTQSYILFTAQILYTVLNIFITYKIWGGMKELAIKFQRWKLF
jgi:hypothetical protein